MATFDLGNVPSPIAQAMRLAQLREANNPNLALQRQIQQAVELQRIQQQSPEGQLALQQKQAQLNSLLQQQDFQQQQQAFEQQRQPLILDELRRQLDPTFKAQQNAANLSYEVDKARQLAQIQNEFKAKSATGFFDPQSGRWIKEVNGQVVASQIPFAETMGTSTPTVSALDIPSVDPTLFSGTPTPPASITPSTPTAGALTGTSAQKNEALRRAEELKKEEQDFRENLQKRSQDFTAEQNRLQREYLQGKDAAKPPKFNKADEVTVNSIAKDNAAKISILNQLLSGAQTFTDPKISDEVKAVEGARLGKILNSTEGKDALQQAERDALLPFLNFEVGNPRGLFDPTRKVFGRNLPAFQQQLDATASSLNRVIDYNNKYIDSVYQKYGQSFTPDSAINISKGNQGNDVKKQEGESSKDYLKRKYGR